MALIGEIRDANTANCAIELATTGHIALSTLHTETALGAITRFRSSFGIDNGILAETIDTLISTRILQKVCKKCSAVKPLREHTIQNIDNHYLNKYLGMDIGHKNIRHANIDGCSDCYRGYDGVMPLIELYQMI